MLKYMATKLNISERSLKNTEEFYYLALIVKQLLR